MKVIELTEWLALHDPEAEVDVSVEIFPEVVGYIGWLNFEEMLELAAEGASPCLLARVYVEPDTEMDGIAENASPVE